MSATKKQGVFGKLVALVCATVLAIAMMGVMGLNKAYADDAPLSLKVTIVGTDGTTEVATKTFTEAELNELVSTADVDGPSVGQYYKGDVWNVYYSAKYVTFDALAEAMGFALADGDFIFIPDNKKWAGAEYGKISSGKFYPAAEASTVNNVTTAVLGKAGDTYASGLALTQAVATGATPQAAYDAASKAEQTNAKCPLSLMGVYADSEVGGNRFWSGIAEIKIKLAKDVEKIKPTIELDKAEYTYNGKNIKPNVIVKNGKTVVPECNYTVAYKDNKVSGKASVTVTLRGNYMGSKTASFKILPAKVKGVKAASTKAKTAKVTWTKFTADKHTGYIVKYSVNSNMKGAKKVDVKASKSSTTIKGLKAKTKYYVQITPYTSVGTKNYLGTTVAKTVKVK